MSGSSSFYIVGNYGGFPDKMFSKRKEKKNGTEGIDGTGTCSQKSAAQARENDVFGSIGADSVSSFVYKQSTY